MAEPKNDVVGPWVEWDVPSPPTRSRMVVDERVRKAYEPGDYRADMRPVTHDDLRKACAAVGLRVVGDAEDREVANLVRALTAEKARAEKAEGEFAGAKRRGDDMIDLASERANTIDDLRTKLAAAERELAHRTAADLESRLSSLRVSPTAPTMGAAQGCTTNTAPVDGEPSYEATCDAWDDSQPGTTVGFGMHQWRAGYAACAARHQPTEPRATEGELVRLFRDADGERPACLVERAVKANVDIEVEEHEEEGLRYVKIHAPVRNGQRMRVSSDADVRATLEAMLTEVGA